MSRNILKEPSARIPGITTISALEEDLDELFAEAVKVVCQYQRASASLIQRRLSIGYARAARLLDQLHAVGVVSEHDGSKPRDVLISSPDQFLKKVTKIARTEIDISEDLQYTKPDPAIVK